MFCFGAIGWGWGEELRIKRFFGKCFVFFCKLLVGVNVYSVDYRFLYIVVFKFIFYGMGDI